jgi:hypothetical protein
MPDHPRGTRWKLASLLIVSLIGFWFTAAPAPVCPNCSVEVPRFTVAETGQSTATTVEVALVTELSVSPATARLIEAEQVFVVTHIRILVDGEVAFDLGAMSWQPEVETRSRERGAIPLEALTQFWGRPRKFVSEADVVLEVALIDAASGEDAARIEVTAHVDDWEDL